MSVKSESSGESMFARKLRQDPELRKQCEEIEAHLRKMAREIVERDAGSDFTTEDIMAMRWTRIG